MLETRRIASRSALPAARRSATASLSVALLALGACSESSAPPLQMTPPTEQHQWLDQLVGEWELTGVGEGEEGAEPMRVEGTMTARSFGGLWVVCESSAEMNGQSFRSLMTVGYDSEDERYVGTWIDTAWAHLWHYEGHLDRAARTLHLEAEGPSFSEPGATATYRDSIEIVSPDHWRLVSSARQEDGEWTKFMSADYRRRN